MSIDTDPDAAVAAVKTRLAAAQRARIRAEHERDAATAQAEHARQQLAAEFGVSTVDDAKRILADLEDDRDQALATLTAALAEIGV